MCFVRKVMASANVGGDTALCRKLYDEDVLDSDLREDPLFGKFNPGNVCDFECSTPINRTSPIYETHRLAKASVVNALVKGPAMLSKRFDLNTLYEATTPRDASGSKAAAPHRKR